MALTLETLEARFNKFESIVNSRLDSLESDVAILKSDVAILKSDVAALKSDVAALKADVATLKSDVAALKADVAEIKSDIRMIKEALTVGAQYQYAVSELKSVEENFYSAKKCVSKMKRFSIKSFFSRR